MFRYNRPGAGFDAFITALPVEPSPEVLRLLRAAHEDGAKSAAAEVTRHAKGAIVAAHKAMDGARAATDGLADVARELRDMAQRTGDLAPDREMD